MNLVDFIILGILGISLLFGLYRGFLSSLLNMGGALVSFAGAFWLFPKLAEYIRGNENLVSTLMRYTDALNRVGDSTLAQTPVSSLNSGSIADILSRVNLPSPLNTLLRVNMEQQVFTGSTTVQQYVQSTILTAAINIISFVVCFVAVYLALSLLGGLLRAVFRLPVLKQLDALVGGAFGLLRGLLLVYIAFALVPLIETIVPLEQVSTMMKESMFAPLFNNGNLILSVMNGRFWT